MVAQQPQQPQQPQWIEMYETTYPYVMFQYLISENDLRNKEVKKL